jgi:hypothetical protein
MSIEVDQILDIAQMRVPPSALRWLLEEESMMNLLEPLVLVLIVFVCVVLLALFNRLAARHDRHHWRE